MKINLSFLLPILVVVTIVNFYFIFIRPDPITSAKIKMLSLSRGQRYFGRLSLWYVYAQNGDWQKATQVEKDLNPTDLIYYKSLHHPDYLRRRLDILLNRPPATASDWLAVAKLSASLNESDQALQALKQATALDPVRPDIAQLYLQLSQ